MKLQFGRTWTDSRLLVTAVVAIPALLACLLYFFSFRPYAATAAAAKLNDLALFIQEGLAPLSSEQQAEMAQDLQRHLGYKLVDDAIIAPKLVPADSGWPGSVSQRLEQDSGGTLKLRITPEDGQLWVNVDGDERRYWLAIPSDRVSAARPLVLAFGTAVAGSFCLLLMLLELRRQSAKIRSYSRALRHVGTGDVAQLLPDTGTEEERDFSRAFNTMVSSLQRLDAESRLLLGGISHDLRTPLTSMRLGLELAKDEMEPGLAASLYQDSQDLELILNQFLDYARDDTLEAVGKGDLNELILDIAKRVSDHGHAIDLDLSPLPSFPFRKLAMRRLITNLVNNAVNYAGVGVGIRTRSMPDGHIVISIVDGGTGLDETQLGQLLRPFVRGTQSENRHPGSGLGLTIASRITRIHGGELTLRNRPEGGLEACIEIPTVNERE